MTDVVFLFTGDLNKMTRSGVVFCTYSLLIQGGGRVADLGKDGSRSERASHETREQARATGELAR